MPLLFLKTLNISIAAGWFVLAVVLLRLLLKRAPKWTHVLLWGLVAVRLVLPFSFESALSLIPSAETIPPSVLTGPSFDVQTGIPPVDNQVNDYLGDHYFEGVTQPTAHGAQVVSLLTVLWLVGIVLMAVYCGFSYLRLRRQVATAVREQDNIYRSEFARTPFVLGLLRPRIYLPTAVAAENVPYVIAHEQAHIQRKDHWWKPLGFLLLSIHWFNPLMWLGYLFLCRDIEMACDEKVIRRLDGDLRADYSQALLSCSIRCRTIAACPLAFGEVGVKERVKNVLNYKKPAFWIILAAVLACVAVAVCFLTDPVRKSPEEPSVEIRPAAVTIWYEQDNPEYAQAGRWTLDAFPGVTFSFDPENNSLFATKDGVTTTIPTGFKIHNIYAADLNGDGYPEICTNGEYINYLSSSSLAVHRSKRLMVYDYANDTGYVMDDFGTSFFDVLPPNLSGGSGTFYPIHYYGFYDYSLRVENDLLICEKKNPKDGEIIATGLLALLDTAEGERLYLAPLPDAMVFPKSYSYQENVSFTLNSDGTFLFSTSPVSSYLHTGTYTLSNGILTLTCDQFVCTFSAVAEGLRYEEKVSTGMDLPDGAIFQQSKP